MLAPPFTSANDALTLAALRDAVCAIASQFDVRLIDRDGAVSAVRTWSSIADAAQGACDLAAARVDECGPPPSSGAPDAADFISKETGITSPTAKDAIARGRRMRETEKTREAATNGKLSPDQTSAITDATAVNPDAE